MLNFNERIKMTVTMDVTISQALALRAMFEYWNHCSKVGSSREIGFYVDGDGDFHPCCEVTFSRPIPKLTDTIHWLSVKSDDEGNRLYDFNTLSTWLRYALNA